MCNVQGDERPKSTIDNCFKMISGIKRDLTWYYMNYNQHRKLHLDFQFLRIFVALNVISQNRTWAKKFFSPQTRFPLRCVSVALHALFYWFQLPWSLLSKFGSFRCYFQLCWSVSCGWEKSAIQYIKNDLVFCEACMNRVFTRRGAQFGSKLMNWYILQNFCTQERNGKRGEVIHVVKTSFDLFE